MTYKYDLQDRLLDFASSIIDLTEMVPGSYAGIHLSKQLLRCGTSPALHYGEAQAAESSHDFVHKMKVCLKELGECFNCLRLIARKKWLTENIQNSLIIECNELISIFVKSIKTAESNNNKLKKNRPGDY